MQWLSDLNDQQRAAATAGDMPIIIVAGPGTGKTKTLTARIAYLLAGKRAKPADILALTFTAKAAQEMRERLAGMLTGPQPDVATFHAFCHNLLGQHRQQPSFVSEQERLALIGALKKQASLKHMSTRDISLAISRYKNGAEQSPGIAVLVAAYNQALAERDRCDFDDLLVDARDLLATNPAVRDQLVSRYRYILVDEFQDTNPLQYELLRLLDTSRLFVIGDPLQSIYGFRGASGDIFARLAAGLPNHQHITLLTNYRSAPEIVQAANAVFGEQPLHAHRTQAGHARVVRVLNEYSEADWILHHIERGVGGSTMISSSQHHTQAGEHTFADFAVLYRTHAVARTVQQRLRDSGIPVQVVGEGSPYELLAVQTIIAALRHTGGQPATDHQTQALAESADAALAPSALAYALAAHAGFLADDFPHKQTVQQFINTIVRFDTRGLGAYLAHLDAIKDQAFYDPSADAVTLLTIHASKGLEFTHVFLVGAEDGILPGKRGDPAEENRLFYVALTRARHALDILYTTKRGNKPSQPSPFLASLPIPRLTDPGMDAQLRSIKKRTAKRSQQSLF